MNRLIEYQCNCKVIKKYHDGQNIYKIGNIYYNTEKKRWIVNIIIDSNKHTNGFYLDEIGFYEWLFDPKYKVLDVFYPIGTYWQYKYLYDKLEQPEKIIKYLAEDK